MPQFPPDMFDEPPADLQRIGAHRSPGRRGGGWVTFAWAALATGVLVGVGVAAVGITSGHGIDLTGGNGSALGSLSTPVPSATPLLDPRTLPTSRPVTITVLNATSHTNLQGTGSKELTAAHWNVVSTADATTSDLKSTIVYYRDQADADVAAGVVAALGTGQTVFTDAVFGSTLQVALGDDYYAEKHPSKG